MTRLAELMDEREISVQQLSELSGIPDRTVYRHAKGETKLDLEQAAAYAKALGVSIEALIRGNGDA